jgi:hypothetical protein
VRRHRVFFSLTVAILFAARWASGTTPVDSGSAGTLEGVVRDSSGAVVLQATVSLRGASGFQRQAATDGRGFFRFERLPPGSYAVTAFRDGFAVETVEVAVTAGSPATVDITLRPANFSEEVTVSFTGSQS